ncbi:ABC-type glycerol-3-phosphate transport system permease component [Deinococcus metalli]|uniref:ABC-type glycerol-3-phosphate transport system permease component n=1 Tax=Deinococcus metalli TaxID=1141878 RepID=A0A7W8KGY8_9DEIO|nr:carbohydrate ABC transporter permease [Deinococcus metalli]MBB5377996.1 ABC-type glycerol-3-phosphate transport system permease component [Deinococcus metalli]GHF53665.1 sugar ABC transporter permease [Deinococcus metalli]
MTTARHTRPPALLYAVLIVVSAFAALPFVWMVLSSLKPLAEIFGQGFWPQHASLDNYRALFAQTPALRALGNSVLIAVLSTAGSLLFCALGGYGFAKFDFPGRNALFGVMLVSMTIPFVVGLIPTFILMRNTFHWIDTPWPLIVPGLANAFGVFFMRQYLSTVPDELLDAARIDGASEPTIFVRVVVPISTPALASLGIIFFMAAWNNYLWPNIVLRNPDAQTLPVLIASLQGSAGRTPYDLMMAGAVVSVIPMLIVFLALQRYFYSGITAGAVKG